MAIAYEPEKVTAEDALGGFKEMVRLSLAAKVFDPWCGLCGSKDWRYEDAKTVFNTIAEAMPYLAELERQQTRLRMSVNRN